MYVFINITPITFLPSPSVLISSRTSDLPIFRSTDLQIITQSRVQCLETDTHQGLDLPGIKSHKWAIHSCSAVTGSGLDGGMDWMISEVAGRLYWNASPPSLTSATSSGPSLDTNSNPYPGNSVYTIGASGAEMGVPTRELGVST